MDDAAEGPKLLEVLTHHDLIDELSQLSVPENVRQAFTEKLADLVKLAKTHGAETRAIAETVPTPSMTIIANSEAASNTDQTSLQVLKPGK